MLDPFQIKKFGYNPEFHKKFEELNKGPKYQPKVKLSRSWAKNGEIQFFRPAGKQPNPIVPNPFMDQLIEAHYKEVNKSHSEGDGEEEKNGNPLTPYKICKSLVPQIENSILDLIADQKLAPPLLSAGEE